MKWIILAGSSNTGKTFTLSEVVIELTQRGGRLIPPSAMPVMIPATSTKAAKYADAKYELSYASKRVVVVTNGDVPDDVEDGYNWAVAAKADVLISASRSKSGSGHLVAINSKLVTLPSLEPYFIAALEHDAVLQPRIRATRVDQIINLI